MNWNNEREEKRLIWYLLGFNDGQIAMLSEPFVGKSNVCSWRGRRALPPNNGLGDRKWYPTNNPSKKPLSNSPGHSLSEEREKFLFRLYNEGLNDPQIANKANRSRVTIRTWRLRKGLPANVSQGGQPVQGKRENIQRKTRKRQTKEESGDKPKKGETAGVRTMGVKQQREEAERAVVESLPTKEEILKMVKNSPGHKITTAKLIKQGYGDVGSKRRDTIGKLRELADKDKKLVLDTSGKEIIWIWTA